MTLGELAAWLDAYGRAWEQQDVDAFVACFDEGAAYHWGPFEEPLRGRAAIRARTERAVSRQRGISFRHEPLAVTPDGRGVAWWNATYELPLAGIREENEGIFLVTLGDDGRCTDFREWWNERELAPD